MAGYCGNLPLCICTKYSIDCIDKNYASIYRLEKFNNLILISNYYILYSFSFTIPFPIFPYVNINVLRVFSHLLTFIRTNEENVLK